MLHQPRVATAAVLALTLVSFTAACGGDGTCTVIEGDDGSAEIVCPDGSSATVPGDQGSCSVTDNGDGTKTLSCADGTRVVVRDGADGALCTVADNGDGTRTISCPDGSNVVIHDGADGEPCSVTPNDDGSKTLTCADGTSVVIEAGADGTSCSVTESAGGQATIACDDGTTVTLPILPSGVLEGDYVVNNPLDAILLSRFSAVTGSLRIASDTLQTCEPQQLVHVGGSLIIDAPYLTNLTWLDGLTSIGDQLVVTGSGWLDSLTGLESVTSVGGDVRIESNLGLASLTGLDQLTHFGGTRLTIRYNRALPQCEAEALRDRFLATGWTGTAELQGNDTTATCR